MLAPLSHIETIHSRESLFEPYAHGKFVVKSLLDDYPPSCVYIGVVKDPKPGPPGIRNWIVFWHIGDPDEGNLHVLEVQWNVMGRGLVMVIDKKQNELPSNLVTFCVGHLNSQELDRLDRLNPIVVSRPISSVWVMEIFRPAIRDGLLEERDVEEGVMRALAVNW